MNMDEMYSPERVAKRVQWLRDHMQNYLDSKYRRDREYGNYLKNYFEEQAQNPNRGYSEPLPYNLYFS